MRLRRHHAGTVLLSAGLLAAAVSAPALASSHHAHKKGTKIATTHVKKLGKVLANSKGDVMYLFNQDGKNVSHCTGACASVWPPVTSKAKPVAAAGIKAKHLGLTKKHHQVTYYGHPLYYFASDTKPRKATGEGVNGFFVVSTKGKEVKPPKKATGLPTGPADVGTATGVGSNNDEVITNSADGHTLYELNGSSGTVPCTGACAGVWPPLLTKGAPTASGDAIPAELGTVKRTVGGKSVEQVTYNGFPVYEYSGDKKAGTDNGQYFYESGGAGFPYWHDLFPNGTPNPATTP